MELEEGGHSCNSMSGSIFPFRGKARKMELGTPHPLPLLVGGYIAHEFCGFSRPQHVLPPRGCFFFLFFSSSRLLFRYGLSCSGTASEGSSSCRSRCGSIHASRSCLLALSLRYDYYCEAGFWCNMVVVGTHFSYFCFLWLSA